MFGLAIGRVALLCPRYAQREEVMQRLRVRIGSVRVFEYQHGGIGNVDAPTPQLSNSPMEMITTFQNLSKLQCVHEAKEKYM